MFNAKIIALVEELANRKILIENGGQSAVDRAYAAGSAYESGVYDGQVLLARQIIEMSAPAAAASTGSALVDQNSAEGVANVAESVIHYAPDVVAHSKDTDRVVECIGVCESTEKFVSETPSDGILSSVGSTIGDIAEGVGDAVGGAFSAVGDVLSSIAD